MTGICISSLTFGFAIAIGELDIFISRIKENNMLRLFYALLTWKMMKSGIVICIDDFRRCKYVNKVIFGQYM